MGSAAGEVREHLLLNVDPDHPQDQTPPTTTSKLQVKNLSKVSDTGEAILRGVNLEIPRGKVTGIIGPSGSGKSTVLRALNRLWEPSPATVFLDGDDICGLDVLSLRRKVGMLFQLPALFEGKLYLVDSMIIKRNCLLID
ncbi:protein STAR1-like isoform X2 [Asparagus officinalis]|uniref:protein STAR1-like isoform X2 n=1 Tax=Asparagus officinalis TaxID=4686 RepID=UPI00098E206F|nr:protein STAR1-like isoform X2 [Asparagus officinalis]